MKRLMFCPKVAQSCWKWKCRDITIWCMPQLCLSKIGTTLSGWLEFMRVSEYSPWILIFHLAYEKFCVVLDDPFTCMFSLTIVSARTLFFLFYSLEYLHEEICCKLRSECKQRTGLRLGQQPKVVRQLPHGNSKSKIERVVGIWRWAVLNIKSNSKSIPEAKIGCRLFSRKSLRWCQFPAMERKLYDLNTITRIYIRYKLYLSFLE